MDPRLDTFLTLCRTMHYGRAAEALNLSQPAVSKHIQALEAQYGAKLFDYSGRRLSRTRAGELLEQYASTLRYNEEKLIAAMHARPETLLRIGATKSIGDYILLPEIRRFLSAPGNRLTFLVDNTARLLSQLEAGELDFAVLDGIFDKARYDSFRVRMEPYIGVCARSHPFGGAALERLCVVDISGMDPRLADCRVTVASDVQNVLCGPQGASRVYGPQKGATPEMAERLDRALLHYAETLRAQLGADVANRPGAGAAGGLGAALYAFMNAQFRRGIDVVLELQDFAGQVQNADLVITGEGRTDGQTLFGKVPMGVAETAKRQGDIPVCVFSGGVSADAQALYQHGVDGLYAIADGPITLQESSARAEELLERTAESVVRTVLAAQRRR